VTVPVLVINAADDPVCVADNVHRHLDAMQQLPRLTLALTRRGGHCGFFEGLLTGESWADRAIAEYLSAAHRLLGGGGISQ
jgi:predicted alpha/beta-fold hydrolase